MRERFPCPLCGHKNLIEWDPGEDARTIPCIACAHDEITIVPGSDLGPDGKSLGEARGIAQSIARVGGTIAAVRGNGEA